MMSKQTLKKLYVTGCAITLLFFYAQISYAQAEWIKRGSEPDKYSMGIDSTVQHEGKNTMTVKSLESEIDGFGTYMQNTTPEKYLGKRIKMTGYIKSKDVKEHSGFWLRVDQAVTNEALSFDNMSDRVILGTTDWKKYEIVLDVPKDASRISFGGLVAGTGQIWFDDIHFEIVENTVPTTGKQ